jgi:polysaccharide export outer membrane protein
VNLVCSLRHGILLLWLGCLTLCASCAPNLPTAQELAAFEKAGPVRLVVDADRLVKAKKATGPYQVIPGDVVELQLPVTVRPDVAVPRQDLYNLQPPFSRPDTVLFRVGQDGKIALPVAGEIKVDGKTLPEIEALVVAAYYPRYLVRPPSVVGKVSEYRTSTVAVVGAVKEPGTYALRHDEMSLVTALMKAGGILPDGSGVVRIRAAETPEKAEPVAVPIKGLNVPFADVAIKDGDTIEVERLDPVTFSVMGLVQKPGSFPYLPGRKVSLMQALAEAGGLDVKAEPEYATVYRQAEDGRILAVVFARACY